MTLRIGDLAPNFEQISTQGKIKFYPASTGRNFIKHAVKLVVVHGRDIRR